MAEVAIRKAEQKDYSDIERLFNLLQYPFDEQPGNEIYVEYPLGNIEYEHKRIN